MNIPDIQEVREKERRVREYLEAKGFDAAIIARQDNFAWFTCGGNNRVVVTSETGFAPLVITREKVYVIAHVMDGPRIFDEELQGLDFEPVFLRWYEASREQKALQMVKGLKVVSDIPLEGVAFAPVEFYKLHYPLTEKEIEKCRQMGSLCDGLLRKIADEIKPGMREHEVEAVVLYHYGMHNMTPEVLLIGSDERISRYRHPNPSDKKIDRFILIHPAARKAGLHANITRMVYFGDKLPADTARKYDAACRVEAAAVSMCVPGTRLADIIEAEKAVYEETGFGDEWRNHFQGLVTGYALGDSALYNDPEAIVSVNQAYDWFVTITGVKVEELSINTSEGREVVSASGKWPVKAYSYNGQSFNLPQILMR